ncbi:MAG: protein kinase [Planctomycetaceae bacterium]
MAEGALAAAFLKSLRVSELLPEEEIATHLKELRLVGINEKDAFELSEAFVKRRWITRWQADMLLDGKHRGFYLGKYRLLSQLGRGGMGAVYLAEHTLMHRRCAIKVLPPRRANDTANLARFEREAHAIAALNHVNIVRAYDFDREQDRENVVHFLVMEYVDGASLQERVAGKGPLAPAKAVDFAMQAAEGLVHAHAQGMIHRDIKPANLLVDANGCLKILDLGLACYFQNANQNENTEREHYTGTVDYLAPEQAIDSRKADARADIYALGCTLYYLLAGHPPFPEGTVPQRLIDHQSTEPKRLEDIRSDVPTELGDIDRKMMSKRPDKRYQTAAEVSQALGAWLREQKLKPTSTAKGAKPASPNPAAQGVKSSKPVSATRQAAQNPFAAIPLDDYSSRRPNESSGESQRALWSGLLTWPPQRKHLPALATAAAALLLMLVALVYSLVSGPDSPQPGPQSIAKAGQSVPNVPGNDAVQKADDASTSPGKEGPVGDVTVGPNGDFKTINEAIAHVKKDEFKRLARTKQRTISVDGGATYAERIVIDNSDLTFPNGVRIVSKGTTRAILSPDGPEPVVKLTGTPKAVEHFTLEGFEIDAKEKPVAIELAGFVTGTKLVNLKLKGFTQTGISCRGTTGFGIAGREFTIGGCLFLGRQNAVGISLAKGNETPAHLTIQDCRFAGPMKGGIVLRNEAVDVAVHNSTFYRIDEAIAFDGIGQVWRDIFVENNTIHLGIRGVTFRIVPSAQSSGLAFRNNLFAELAGYECSCAGKLEERLFLKMVASNGISNNWTSRPEGKAPSDPAQNEIDLIQQSGRRGAEFDFASADPESSSFLHPAAGAPNGQIGARPKNPMK